MEPKRVRYQSILDLVPPPWPAELWDEISHKVQSDQRTMVILDDDPTGTQTTHGLYVLTDWSVRTLNAELKTRPKAFFILTNSRSMTEDQARSINLEIGRNLSAARRLAGRDFVLASRSDSTLRGHFPAETEALCEATGERVDATLVVPFFWEGGRFTFEHIHYVRDGEWLIPAGETEFARDVVFGYRESDLRKWVREKYRRALPRRFISSLSLSEIRSGGPDVVLHRLMELYDNQVCVIDALDYHDLEVIVAGLLDAEASGKRFIYRTAASFIRVRAGVAPRSPLTPHELMAPSGPGGLYLVGSYVNRTTQQLNELLQEKRLAAFLLPVEAALGDCEAWRECERIADKASDLLAKGSDVVIYTSRELLTSYQGLAPLEIGGKISAALVSITRKLGVRPRYIVAKGGITSSDIATKALDVKRAMVMGQAIPGVPVWRLGEESRFPGLDYVVFPGNVGGAHALVEIYHLFSGGG